MTHHPNSRRPSRLAAALTIAAAAGLALAGVASPVSAKRDRGSKSTATQAAATIDPATLPLGSMYHVVDQIGARTLWEQGITGAGVNVAVIDTGVAAVDALRGADKVVAMADFSLEAGVPEAVYVDTYGHGTHMAGIIAGRDPGADPATSRQHPEWFLGVAPDAGLVSVKAGDNSGDVDVSQIIASIDWVVEHADELDIRVLNLSFSSHNLQTYLTDPLTAAVERAWDADIVVVVAAGNDGLGEARLGVPANDPYVIAVGGLEAVEGGRYVIPDWATNGNGLRNPDVGAPGAHIDSLRAPRSRVDEEHPEGRVGDNLFRGSGSSQAAAVTAGAAALMLQAQPWLSPDQVKAKLERSADSSVTPWGSSIYRGDGAIRVDRALGASTFWSTQMHPPATGLGSLQESRGSFDLEINGLPLIGDVTIHGDPWLGATWTSTRWSGGTWDSTRWSGASWMGSSWSDATWTGARWSGSSWSGVDWSSTRWSEAAWSGSSWSGSSWSGSSWSGSNWSSTRWSSTRWSGTRWS